MIGRPRPGSAAPIATGRLAWQDEAACRGEDPGLFFGADGEDEAAELTRTAKAKAICASCPVTAPCREFAMSAGIRDGIWGGVDFGERLCGNKIHRMTAENTLDRGDGTVNCRACRRVVDKRYRMRQAERAA
jgi:WhiB family redox-sensing transcriptional regulator